MGFDEGVVSKRAAPFKIVLVISSLQGGGAERQLSGMANYWAVKGMQVTLATWSGSTTSEFYSLDSQVRRAYMDVDADGRVTYGSILRGLLKLRRLLSQTRPNVVLSFMTRSNVLTILAGMRLAVPIIVSERVQPAVDSTLPPVWRLLRGMLYSRTHDVVVQTFDAAAWIKRHCRKDATVIPNFLRALPLIASDREPLIVAIGRLANQKGFDLLLKAFARIASDFESWDVVIIGTGSERAELLRLRDELLLTDRVQFLGEIDGVESWMARAGLVVQPSRFEGFPNVILESMGMGAAVVCADCPSGPSDLIEDGVNGCLVPAEDVTALAQRMAQLMAQPMLRERLGREALKVRERFRQDLIMRQWEACLRADTELMSPHVHRRSVDRL